MTHPQISIVMPVYNSAATLDSTVASIRSQTQQSFELIAIDDGSTDDSLTKLLGHAKLDDRIKVVSRKNAGVSSARNLGVELARAPLIAFMDSDDMWAPKKLANHIRLHEDDPRAAASYARTAFIAEDARGLESAKTTSSLCPHIPQLVDVLGENPICTASNVVVRRDWFNICGGFDAELSFAEDQDLVAKLISKGGRVRGIDKVLTGYRFSSDGLSMNLDHMHKGWRIVVERYLDASELNALEALYCRYLARRVLRAGGPPWEALSYTFAGLRLDASSFLRERRRGLSLLIAVLAYPIIPSHMRRRLFA